MCIDFLAVFFDYCMVVLLVALIIVVLQTLRDMFVEYIRGQQAYNSRNDDWYS